MNLPVVLRSEAGRDVEEARDFFNARSDGLGQSVLDRLKETLTRIESFPKLYTQEWRNMRAARVRKFKYIVYYRIHSDRIEVVAVMFGGRDSVLWKSRV